MPIKKGHYCKFYPCSNKWSANIFELYMHKGSISHQKESKIFFKVNLSRVSRHPFIMLGSYDSFEFKIETNTQWSGNFPI